MKPAATFYRADCAVCVAAEQQPADAIDPARVDCEVVPPARPSRASPRPKRPASRRSPPG